MRVLLVDDEPGIREGLAFLLRKKGLLVTTAADCAAAAAALAADAFDVVVTDWRLPDGVAGSYLGGCTVPVVAVSGHPEEVVGAPALRAVLAKPVAPNTLLAWLERLAEVPAAAPAAALPADVAGWLATAREILGDDATVDDDGTYVTLSGALAQPGAAARLALLGGDMQISGTAATRRVRLRWYRDGRPAAPMPIVAPTCTWPNAAEFAVDLHGAAGSPADFAAWLDRAVAHRSNGEHVHFLNVPPAMHFWATSQGRAHDMPMRGPAGPRLSAELAELWSEP